MYSCHMVTVTSLKHSLVVLSCVCIPSFRYLSPRVSQAISHVSTAKIDTTVSFIHYQRPIAALLAIMKALVVQHVGKMHCWHHIDCNCINISLIYV